MIMLLQWNGHSEFLLESADGCRVLTDPFDDHVGYPMREVRADAVTVSHGHGDHSGNHLHVYLCSKGSIRCNQST